jgi:hypothetical protein
MMQLPRLLRSVVFSVSLAVIGVPYSVTCAQEAPEAAPGDASKELTNAVENYWHYGKIARYDLAAAEGQKILESKDNPVAILETFEKVAASHKDNMDQWLLRWQGVDPMRDVSVQIINVINEGYRTRRADPVFIESSIKRLSTNERAYRIGMGRLRESGELAVPIMLDYLRDPAKKEYHNSIRRALRDLGVLSLNPLLAATEMKDNETLITVISALGDIGYDVSVPYLARLANSPDHPAAVQAAAVQAVGRIGAGDAKSLNVADLYYQLAEKFYYNNAAFGASKASPVAYVWFWNDETGLRRTDVPAPIFNDIMAMRESEYALKIDPNKGDAVSLWLASNYKRESDLPDGATDPTRAENQPSAHYYGVAAGAQYLNNALARSLRDRDSEVALRVIKSLQEIVGQSNMLTGNGQSLLDALQYPDRLVRFEAAFAIAAALPQESFLGQERVVPLLAEAVSQTGRPNVLVLVSEDKLNGQVQALKDAGYGATGGGSAEAAVAASNSLPSVDVILVSGDLDAKEIDLLISMSMANARLSRSAKLVMIQSDASPYAVQAQSDMLMNTTKATEGEPLKTALEEARTRSGALPLDEQAATAYALRSAGLLKNLAISRGQVLDLAAAEPTLLAALDDARPDIVKASGEVLGLMNSQNAQVGLLANASEDGVADDVKISLYKSLATNAKFYGNKLDDAQIAVLQGVVEKAENLDVRSAAAEARGALNLPADQARTLIVNQSRV